MTPTAFVKFQRVLTEAVVFVEVLWKAGKCLLPSGKHSVKTECSLFTGLNSECSLFTGLNSLDRS